MNLPDLLLGRTGPQRFDRATRLSMVAFLLMPPLMMAGALSQLEHPPAGWVGVGSLALATVGSLWAAASAWPALDGYLGRRTPHRSLLPTGFLLLAAGLAWNALLAPTEGYGWSTPHGLACLSAIAPAAILACLLPAPRQHRLMAAVILVPALVSLARGVPPRTVALTAVLPALFTLMMVYTCRFSGWMLQVLAELEQARTLGAQLAVAEERLRFSRDLHDVVGRSLSAIALKSQLAAELSRREQHDRARAEMVAVHGLADEGLTEMRAVVAGYRKTDLAAELSGARAMLEAAGVQAEVDQPPALTGLPDQTREALGWAVRECVTNVVRHSQATWCRLAFEQADGVRLTVTNDGLRRGRRAPAGSGLVGLAERLAPLGGNIRHGPDGAHFVVCVQLPLPPTPHPQEDAR
ncbi:MULTISPECIES: sensor histidine kinase [unclassified Luteococcus]|uniref:sensor histidine kinase n=1 Tax=unclassified Luteococcus TaxID=2639923 RepID=UPI00313A9F6B